jgi:hypothetical protein
MNITKTFIALILLTSPMCFTAPKQSDRTEKGRRLIINFKAVCLLHKELKEEVIKEVETQYQKPIFGFEKIFFAHMLREHGITLKKDFLSKKANHNNWAQVNNEDVCPICRNLNNLRERIKTLEERNQAIRRALHALGIDITFKPAVERDPDSPQTLEAFDFQTGDTCSSLLIPDAEPQDWHLHV